MEFESFKRGRGKFFASTKLLINLKSYKKKKTTQKLKAKKHKTNNLKEKELKNMKLENLGNLLQDVRCVVCVSPTS
jgi:ABC-type lipoprotein export system ATPase subunit